MRVVDRIRRWVGVRVVWFWDCGSGVLESAGWKRRVGARGFGRKGNFGVG